MNDKAAQTVSHYLLSPPRTLRDACRQTGRDNGGERCPICPVRDLCESDDRWLVRGISSGLEFVDLSQRARRVVRDNASRFKRR
jgi:hypothetical protein